MRIADIVTDTVVYAVHEGSRHYEYRAVVLDTDRWEVVQPHPRGTRWPSVGARYRLAETWVGVHRGNAYSNDQGMLAIQAGGRSMWGDALVAAEKVTNAELIDIAAAVAVTIRAGERPVLPTGVKVRIMRPTDVVCTWAEHEAAEQRRRDDLSEQRRRLDDERARECAAAERMRAVLGGAVPRMTTAGMTWVELERVCRVYAMALGVDLRTIERASSG
jgi:hypothetical protein